MARRGLQLLLSAEHASNAIPRDLRPLFSSRRAQAALASHRGWDPGSLVLARGLSRRLGAPLVAADASRLIVDLNRSTGHRGLFSEFTGALEPEAQARLVKRFHAPHHACVRAHIEELVRRGPVLHVALHSFTPVWEGAERKTELGLLYDPSRTREKALAAELCVALRRATNLTIHRNAPYRGVSDGLPTSLRRVFADARYAGLEIEVNQKFVASPALPELGRVLGDALEALIS